MLYREVNGDSRPNKQRTYMLCLCVIMIVTVPIAVALWLILGTVSSGSLKTKIMTRCQTYLKENSATTSQIDCEKIWDLFMQAFVGRDPCDVPPEAYDSLMDTAPRNPACNRTLFWSKTKDIVHAFTEKRNCYLTLEDTALGSILDGLIWCGKNDSQETLTTACPGWSDCVNNPVRSFWKRASVAFAACACGDVSVMLNGSIDVPFDPESIFASVEVKHFNSSIMNGLKVLLVTKETDTKTCESDTSLKNLQKQLDPKLKYKCEIVLQSKILNCISQPQIACGHCW